MEKSIKARKTSVGLISWNTSFALADNPWFQRRWSKKWTVSTVTASTSAQCSDLELEATTKAKLKGQKTQAEWGSMRFPTKNDLTNPSEPSGESWWWPRPSQGPSSAAVWASESGNHFQGGAANSKSPVAVSATYLSFDGTSVKSLRINLVVMPGR